MQAADLSIQFLEQVIADSYTVAECFADYLAAPQWAVRSIEKIERLREPVARLLIFSTAADIRCYWIGGSLVRLQAELHGYQDVIDIMDPAIGEIRRLRMHARIALAERRPRKRSKDLRRVASVFQKACTLTELLKTTDDKEGEKWARLRELAGAAVLSLEEPADRAKTSLFEWLTAEDADDGVAAKEDAEGIVLAAVMKIEMRQARSAVDSAVRSAMPAGDFERRVGEICAKNPDITLKAVSDLLGCSHGKIGNTEAWKRHAGIKRAKQKMKRAPVRLGSADADVAVDADETIIEDVLEQRPRSAQSAPTLRFGGR